MPSWSSERQLTTVRPYLQIIENMDETEVPGLEATEPFPPLPNSPAIHRDSTFSIGSRERGYTLESLKNGKMLFSNESPRAYYEPKDHSNWINGLSDDFFIKSIRDIHAWALRQDIHDFDVTMFACSKADMIRFELRMESNDFNKIRKRHDKPPVVEDWHEKPNMYLQMVKGRIIQTALGAFQYCNKRPRIIFLLNGPYLPFRGSVDELSNRELRKVQKTLLQFVSERRRDSGFAATYSMGGWRRSYIAHIKIRFPESNVLEGYASRGDQSSARGNMS